jgi:acetyl/propionyl-CoA carboxylase alpha subunit
MPQITAHNKIVLKAMYGEGGTQNEEGIAAAACNPGMNVVMTTAVESMKRQTYTPGATSALGGGAKVVKERAIIGASVDEVIPSGDDLLIHVAMPGDVLQVLVASGQTIAKGDSLLAIASGLWNKAGATPPPYGAAEALESSGGVALTANTLMRCRVL